MRLKLISRNARTSSHAGTEEASTLLHYSSQSFYPAVSLLSFSVSTATLRNCQFVEGFSQEATSAVKHNYGMNEVLTAKLTLCCPALDFESL